MEPYLPLTSRADEIDGTRALIMSCPLHSPPAYRIPCKMDTARRARYRMMMMMMTERVLSARCPETDDLKERKGAPSQSEACELKEKKPRRGRGACELSERSETRRVAR